VGSEGICQWKIPIIPSGIEPATFRFIALLLHYCATANKIQRPSINIQKSHYENGQLRPKHVGFKQYTLVNNNIHVIKSNKSTNVKIIYLTHNLS